MKTILMGSPMHFFIGVKGKYVWTIDLNQSGCFDISSLLFSLNENNLKK